jgi:peptidase M48-like protein
MLATGLLTVPIRMLLLSWYRESEVSADRAALVVLGSHRRFELTLLELLAGDSEGRNFAVGDGSITELLQTHPSASGRLRLAKEFASTPEFLRARGRILDAAASSRLMSSCNSCGFLSPKAEPFCPSCGLSRR